MSIPDTQDEIINEFSLLDGDLEMSVLYLMELGQKLPPIKEEDKVEANTVKGCQSGDNYFIRWFKKGPSIACRH